MDLDKISSSMKHLVACVKLFKILSLSLLLIFTPSVSFASSTFAINQVLNKTIERTVYVTKTGTKYHAASCHHLRCSKIAIGLEDAKKMGYSPFKNCLP